MFNYSKSAGKNLWLLPLILMLPRFCTCDAQTVVITVVGITPMQFDMSVQENIKMEVASNINDYCMKLSTCSPGTNIQSDNILINNIMQVREGITFHLSVPLNLQLNSTLVNMTVERVLREHHLEASVTVQFVATIPTGVILSPKTIIRSLQTNMIVMQSQTTATESLLVTSTPSEESFIPSSIVSNTIVVSSPELSTEPLLAISAETIPVQRFTTQLLSSKITISETMVPPENAATGLPRTALILIIVGIVGSAIVVFISFLAAFIFWRNYNKRKNSKLFPLSNETPLEPLNENLYTTIQRPEAKDVKPHKNTAMPYEMPLQSPKITAQPYEVPSSSHGDPDVPVSGYETPVQVTPLQMSPTTVQLYEIPMSSPKDIPHPSIAQSYEVPVQPYLTPIQQNSSQNSPRRAN